MSLKNQMIADSQLFVSDEDFGEKVVYLPQGDDIGFEVSVQFAQGAIMVNGRLLAIESEGTLLLPKSAVPVVLGGDRFRRADGVVWHIDKSSVRGSDVVFWRLAVKLDPLPTWRGA